MLAPLSSLDDSLSEEDIKLGREEFVSESDIAEAKENLGDWRWRMNNLYYIVNRRGKKVKFKLNRAQRRLFKSLWTRNILLKARQLGMTTAVQIFMLDQCLFVDNKRAGVIAHGLKEAEDIFENKIKFAYDNLPAWLKAIKPTKRSSGKQIRFHNGSFISVGTSMRSGNYDILHVSEFGKICRQAPERAREIVTGSFPAVADTGIIFIESTAEGEQGYFYDYAQDAEDLMVKAMKLTKHDYKFFFFPWWDNPEYQLDDEGVELTEIPDRLEEYFYELEVEQGIDTTDNQRAWYVKQEKLLGDDIFREYPATPKEAFKQIIKGSYFKREFTDIYAEKRITTVPHQPGIPVNSWWDLGMRDMMSIWLTQTIGGTIHVIGYIEDCGKGMKHYIDMLRKLDYSYGEHYGPHDLEVRELMGDGKSRVEKAKDWGFIFNVVPKVQHKHDAIDLARDALAICVFDELNTDLGVQRLKNYRREWDQKLGAYKNTPLHDVNSNGADAFMTLACGHPMFRKINHDVAARIQNVSSGRTM